MCANDGAAQVFLFVFQSGKDGFTDIGFDVKCRDSCGWRCWETKDPGVGGEVFCWFVNCGEVL